MGSVGDDGSGAAANPQPTYVYLGCRPWHAEAFAAIERDLPGHWLFLSARDDLTLDALRAAAPRYVFFAHWSWIVPAEIVEEFECVNFHMTDLPFGRGGSPLQNLVLRGCERTVLTAHRMTAALDDGPIYAQRELSLDGTAEAVYLRATRLTHEIIAEMIEREPEPRPQVGAVVEFSRRRPCESRIADDVDSLDGIYDFIRMLDADGYPHAFIDRGALRFEFRRAARYDERVVADVVITHTGGGES
jgi:methionyl-tRNA formyltransferase